MSADPHGPIKEQLLAYAKVWGVYVAVFLVGGLVSFAYSYSPLHKAKNWKIDYLEERLSARSDQVEELRARIEAVEEGALDRAQQEKIAQLEAKLGEASGEMAGATKELAREKTHVEALKKELARLERDAKAGAKGDGGWKKQIAALEEKNQKLDRERAKLAQERDALQQRLDRFAASAKPSALPAPVASPAPVVSAAPTSTIVELGGSWVSEDERARFDLVAVDGGKAQIVVDSTQLAPGAKPEVLHVAPGEAFEVGSSVGSGARLMLVSIRDDQSIEVAVAN